VFLSYASQDAEAAKLICEALRAAGVEVWFDQSELQGGDAWDRRIRTQIHECRLFVPIVSVNTEARIEGYFRREWKLAVDRTHDLSERAAFLVPVVIDATPELTADVPETFRRIQWTRLPRGETPSAFVERVQRLLVPEAPTSIHAAASAASRVAPARKQASVYWWPKRILAVIATVILLAGAYLAVERLRTPQPAAPAVFSPPPHSIAVLPFVNLSGEKEQEYFSDGLTEELLNSLAQINSLQVAARTSSFSFREHPDITTVAHKLNVSAVLEGSVRRSEHTVRVTAQLINAVTGFHLWSKTYDRDLGDVLNLQTEIATAVAQALKVTLLGDIPQKIELGGSRNPAAFDAYLRGRRIERTGMTAEEEQKAIAAFTEAIRLDPEYALAFAERSLALINYADKVRGPAATRKAIESALKDARTATNLAPDLAEGYYALGVALSVGTGEFAQADEAFARAVALAPGSARILASYSRRAAQIGHSAVAIDAGRRAITLDPLNFHVHRTVGIALLLVRQYPEAVAAFQTAIALQPDFARDYILLGQTQYAMGEYEAARKSCEVAPDDDLGQVCLAMTYRKLGRDADAQAILQRMKSNFGDEGAYAYAEIYAQWGDLPKALEWLETAVRLSNSGLEELKAEPDFDPLREEPRFKAIVRALKFPE
jgi:TolB-like protein/cytochrome c-type biogenesis protein CcmH/NrfG